MTYLPRFQFAAPRCLEDAVAALHSAEGRGRILAGGTDLLPRIQRGQLRPSLLVSLDGIEALHGIEWSSGRGLRIGATARLVDVREHSAVREHYPALVETIGWMATPQIRNMATLAGNLCNGSPCADTVPTLTAAGALVELLGPAGERTVRLDDLFRGPGLTVLMPDELLVAVAVPPPRPAVGLAFEKLPARTRVDVSAVNAGVSVARGEGNRCAEVRIVLGAVGPTPIRARAAEALLAGRILDEATLSEAGALAASETTPISDVRASAAYRRAMAAVLTRRALARAAARAGMTVRAGGIA